MRTKKGIRALSLLLAAAITFSGCSPAKSGATLININNGGDQIPLSYGNFVFHYDQAMYDTVYRLYYGDEYWGEDIFGDGEQDAEASLKNSVIEEIEEAWILRSHAEEYKVSISDAEEKRIDEAAKKFLEENESDTLKELGATESIVEEYLRNLYYRDKVEEAAKEALDIEVTDEEAKQKTISYVLIDTADLTDDEKEEKENDAKELSELSESSSFETTAEEKGLTVSTESFGKTDLDAAKAASEDDEATYSGLPLDVLNEADSLKDDEISGVIETENGYYVIRMDNSDDEEKTEEKRESLLSERQTEGYDELLDGWKEETDFKVNERLWKKVSIVNLFERYTEEDISEEE